MFDCCVIGIVETTLYFHNWRYCSSGFVVTGAYQMSQRGLATTTRLRWTSYDVPSPSRVFALVHAAEAAHFLALEAGMFCEGQNICKMYFISCCPQFLQYMEDTCFSLPLQVVPSLSNLLWNILPVVADSNAVREKHFSDHLVLVWEI